MKKNIVIIISGPTASGKTNLSIQLAHDLKENFNLACSIVNFDSLLFYREISIGSARPTVEEMEGIDHYLVGSESISNPINAADFVKKANPIIEKLHKQDHIIFLVGGSGFYLQALLEGMYPSTTTPKKILDRSNDLYETSGINPFWELLQKNDPESSQRLHINDHYRIRRAVEHFWANGSKFSDQQKIFKKSKRDNNSPWNTLHLHLDIPKEKHFEIITARTRSMEKNGLIDEVKALLSAGFTGLEKPLLSIGYKEAQLFLQGKFSNVEELIERINISTRQLAKAQRTWFKKIINKHCFNYLEDREKIKSTIHDFLQE